VKRCHLENKHPASSRLAADVLVNDGGDDDEERDEAQQVEPRVFLTRAIGQGDQPLIGGEQPESKREDGDLQKVAAQRSDQRDQDLGPGGDDPDFRNAVVQQPQGFVVDQHAGGDKEQGEEEGHG